MTFGRAQSSRCWQIFIEVGANIPASKCLKIYPPDYPKDAACLKHLLKSISFRDAALSERNVLPISAVNLICK